MFVIDYINKLPDPAMVTDPVYINPKQTHTRVTVYKKNSTVFLSKQKFLNTHFSVNKNFCFAFAPFHTLQL